MNQHLQDLNAADSKSAQSAFRDCCGSRRWAQLMTLSRPFESEEELLRRASEIWNDLENEAWFEAFASHPKIGGKKAVVKQPKRAAEWSDEEQSAMADAGEEIRAKLADLNRLYEEKFGFIFIVCASGKSPEEMLELCRKRLGNKRDTEIKIAAEEQRKITEIRLKKLFHQ